MCDNVDFLIDSSLYRAPFNLFIHPSIHSPILPSIHPYFNQSIYLSIPPLIHPSIHPSITRLHLFYHPFHAFFPALFDFFFPFCYHSLRDLFVLLRFPDDVECRPKTLMCPPAVVRHTSTAAVIATLFWLI